MINRLPLIFLFSLAAATAFAGPSVSSVTISQQIDAVGAKSVLEKMYGDNAKWSQLLSGIATGSKDWLSVANGLRRVSDAGASEQLAFAVGEALEHRPEVVLSLSATDFGVDVVCGGPDVDDARFNSYERAMASIAKRESMVRSIRKEALQQLQDSCIASLRKARVSIATFYGKK